MLELVSGISKEIKNNCTILQVGYGLQFGFEFFDVRFGNHPPRFCEVNDLGSVALKDLFEAAQVTCTSKNDSFYLLASFTLSPLSAGSLARMPSGYAVIEKPLRSEVVRERRRSWTARRSYPKMTTGAVLLDSNFIVSKPLCGSKVDGRKLL